ncbi:MAG: 8-oxo-dGTP diphosphatase MutT [Verrucomicrobia bacterium]|jgi:mutator protein MutT|nr:8-oxo-dGTP diphosphatase MutT [Verrucomicrobiota bacterium]
MDPDFAAGFQDANSPTLQRSNTPDSPLIEVAAGLIFRDGQLLIAQRYPGSHQGGLWEFPGGKREPGETFEAALVRELAEELGVRVEVGELIENILHRYPDKSVHIQFYRCEIRAGEPRALGCHALRWVRQARLREQDFPAADARLLDRLVREDRLWVSAG